MDKILFIISTCVVAHTGGGWSIPNFLFPRRTSPVITGGRFRSAVICGGIRRISPAFAITPTAAPAPSTRSGPSDYEIREERRQREAAEKKAREEEDQRKKAEKRHKKEMKEMKDQLKDQRDQISNLMQKLQDLAIQFSQSRSNFFEYVNQKPKNDIIARENLAEVLQKAKEELKLDTKNYYNFSVIGHVKTGKSSIINALRGIDDDDPKAAKVGISETTQTIQMYVLDKNVRIYDIPGAGTLSHNAGTYFKDKYLCAFDCLIICIQDSLGEEEINFAIQALKFKQPIVFIRSRCDIVLDTAKKTKKIRKIDQTAVVKYIDEMNKFYLSEVEKIPALSEVKCFFISAFTLRDLISGEEPDAIYQEQAFLDYIKVQSKQSRSILS